MRKLYSVFDSKSLSWSPPQVWGTHQEALRAFAAGAQDPQTMLYKFPGDFGLFCVGEFDDEKGMVTGHLPQSLALAQEFTRPLETPPAAARMPNGRSRSDSGEDQRLDG